MAFSAVQRKGKAGLAVSSLSIGSGDGWATPTSGNLIVVSANSDATVSTPTGYTAGPSVVDGNGAYLFWKVSDGTESTVTVTPGSAANTAMTACEYSGNAASPLDVSNSSTISGSAGTTTTSVSVTTTAANALVIAVALIHSGLSGTAATSPSWTNSFVNQVTATNGNTTITTDTFYAELIQGNAGAVSTSASWTNSANDRQELVIAFKAQQVIESGTTTYKSVNTATVTTAAFTPANNTLLVAYCSMGNGAGSASSLGAVTDSLSGTWVRLAGEASATGGVAEVWCRDIGTGASMTVTYDPGGAAASGVDIIVKWYIGAALTAQQPGATAVNGGTTSYTTAITTTVQGSLVAGAFGRATDAQTLTANSSTTILGQVNGTSGDTAALFRATNNTVTPGSTTLGFTNAASGTNRMALAEILPTPPAAAAIAGGIRAALPPFLLFRLAAADQAMWHNAATGQAFSQSLAGTLTSSGALTKAITKPSLAGTVASAGSLAKAVTKPGLAGTVTTSGALAKQANKDLAGAVASAGSVTRTALKALAGTASSAGALAKAVAKPGLAGSSTPVGALAKQVNKALSGVLTSSGALTTVKVVLRSFAGTMASSGALAKQAKKALAGSAASAGALTRQVAKALSGAAASAGALAKVAAKALAGSLTSSGALSTIKIVIRSFAGTLTSSGTLTRQAQKALSGTLASSGLLRRAAAKALAGAATFAGELAKLVAKPLAGSVALSGLAQIVKGVFGLPGFLFPSTRSGSAASTTRGPRIGESTASGRIGSATASAHLDSSTDGGQA